MQGVLMTLPGIEDLAALEVKELLGKKATLEQGSVVFPATGPELLELAYRAQTATRVLLLLGKGTIKEVGDIPKLMSPTLLKQYIPKDTLFAVRAKRLGEHSFSSKDIEEAVGKEIDGKVQLKEPHVLIFVSVSNHQCTIGIDIAGFDLSKRSYKMFPVSNVKPTLAYAMARLGKQRGTLLDPFCKDGQIGIEAALWSQQLALQEGPLLMERFANKEEGVRKQHQMQIYCSDTDQRHLTAAEKNAKIAGVHEHIHFNKYDVEWLDTKFEQGSVDSIVTIPPQPGRRTKTDALKKVYQELFYQANYVLAKEGTMVVLGNALLEQAAQQGSFSMVGKREVWQGRKPFQVLVFQRK